MEAPQTLILKILGYFAGNGMPSIKGDLLEVFIQKILG